MAFTYMFAGLPVTDYRSAYEWYANLIGRPADVFPHDTEAVWRLTPHSAMYVLRDQGRAGSGLLTVAVHDLALEERRLTEAGISFVEQATGGAPRRLVVSDPDGNRLSFFQDPAQPPA